MAGIEVPVITPDQVPGLAPVHVAPLPESSALTEGVGGTVVGRGIQDLASGISEYAQKAKKSTDQSEFLHAASALSDWRSRNIDAKALQAKGAAAKGIADQGLVAYDAVVQQLTGTLSNREQRDMFARHVAEDRDLTVKHLLVHESQQLEVQGELDYKAGLDSIASDAGLQWKVAGGPEVKMAEGDLVVAARANLKQWSDVQRLEAARDFRSKAVAAVVMNATANPSDAGSAYASAFLSRYATLKVGPRGEVSPDTSGLIDADMVHKLWSAVRSADTRDTVESTIKQVYTEVPPDKLTGIPDLEAQMKWVTNNVKRGDVAEHTRTQLRQLWDASKVNQAERDKSLSGSMLRTIDEGQLSGAIPSLAEVQADPRFQGASEEGRGAMLRSLVTAADQMRVRANAYGREELQKRGHDSNVALDRFSDDFLNAEPGTAIANIKTREDLAMVLKEYPQLTAYGQMRALEYAQIMHRATTEKLPFKLSQYVEQALRRAYSGDGDRQTRDQLRGPMSRSLIEFMGSVDPGKTRSDKEVREFLRGQLNSKVDVTNIGGFGFGGRPEFLREEEDLEQAAERGY